jgi:hypothetical protein
LKASSKLLNKRDNRRRISFAAAPCARTDFEPLMRISSSPTLNLVHHQAGIGLAKLRRAVAQFLPTMLSGVIWGAPEAI